MPFRPGTSGNPNGRKKGSKNRTPEELRKVILDIVSDNIDILIADLQKMDSEKRFSSIEKLLRHVLPRPLDELERLSDEALDEIVERLKAERNDKNR